MEITRGKISAAQKVVIYGPEGIGKSTFASHFPEPIFIDTEGSTKKLDVARLPKPSSWTMLMEQVRYIKSNLQICKTLVIDTADWAEHLCVQHICSKSQVDGLEGFGYGKGYVYLSEEFGRLLNLLEDVVGLGINVVMTAHAQMRKFEQPDEMGSYDRWEMKLEKKTAPLVKEWADMILFANYKTYVINVDNQGAAKGKNKAQGGIRVMYTTHHPCWDAKNRDNLKPELPFDYVEIEEFMISSGTASLISSPPTPASTSSQAPSGVTTYWHNQDNGQVFEINPGGDMPATEGVLFEISKDEYDKKRKQSEQKPLASAAKPETSPSPTTRTPGGSSGLPKALLDLMTTNNVTEAEIQKVCFQRHYYPQDTPIQNYDPNFISGVLVGAWPQVFKMILEARKLPF